MKTQTIAEVQLQERIRDAHRVGHAAVTTLHSKRCTQCGRETVYTTNRTRVHADAD